MDVKKIINIIFYLILLIAALFSMAFIVTMIFRWYYSL